MKRLLILLLLPIQIFSQGRNLEYYVSFAKNNSPLLKDYQGQIQSGQVDSQLIAASYKPQVIGNSNNYYAPVINGYGYDYAITNGGQLSALVQARKTFVGKNNLESQYEAIRIQNRFIGNTSAIAENDLRKTVTSQYIVVYGDMVSLNFNREVLSVLEKEDAILKSLTQNNTYNQTDYLTFHVSLQQQQLLARQTQIQFRNDYAILNYLCGIVDTTSVSIADPNLHLREFPDVYNSIYYQQFSIDSLRFLNQASVIHYSYRPKLDAFADAGYNSTLAYQGYRNFGTSFGLSLIVPIYDGRQKKLKLNKVGIAEKTRTAYRDFFLKQYDQQIAQLIQQLKATESLIEEINGQIKYANRLIEVNGKLLETGNIRITDFIIAINTYLNARNLLNQNYVNRLQIINQINYWQ